MVTIAVLFVLFLALGASERNDAITDPNPCRFSAPTECYAERFADLSDGDKPSDADLDVDGWLADNPSIEVSSVAASQGPSLVVEETYGTETGATCETLVSVGAALDIDSLRRSVELESFLASTSFQFLGNSTGVPQAEVAYGTIGFIFQYQDKDNYYAAEVSETCARFVRWDDGVHEVLASATVDSFCGTVASPAVCSSVDGASEPRVVQLEVDGPGKEFTLSVAGSEVLSFTYAGYSGESDSVGIYMSRTYPLAITDILVHSARVTDSIVGYDDGPADPEFCVNLRSSSCVYLDFEDEVDDEIIAANGASVNPSFSLVEDGKRKEWDPYFGKQHAKWEYKNGEIRQTVNGGQSQTDDCVDGLGTYLIVHEVNQVKSPERLIRVRMRLDNSGSVGLMYSYRRPVMGVRRNPEYMRFDLSSANDCQNLVRYRNGTFIEFSSDSVNINNDEWYVVEIWVSPRTTEIVVDGKLVAVEENPGFAAGEIALFCYESSRCRFDSVLAVERRVAHLSMDTDSPVSDPALHIVESTARSQLGGTSWSGVLYREHATQTLSAEPGCAENPLTQSSLALFFDSHGHMDVQAPLAVRDDTNDVSWDLTPISEYRYIDGLSSTSLFVAHYDPDTRTFPSPTGYYEPQYCEQMDATYSRWTTRDRGAACSSGESEGDCCLPANSGDLDDDVLCSSSGSTYQDVAQVYKNAPYSPLFPPTLTITEPTGPSRWFESDTNLRLAWVADNVLGTEQVTIEAIRPADQASVWIANVPIDRSNINNAFGAVGEYIIPSLPKYVYADQGYLVFRVKLNASVNTFDTVAVDVRCDQCRSVAVSSDARLAHCTYWCTEELGCIDGSECPGEIECSQVVKGWGGQMFQGEFLECHRFEQNEPNRCGFQSGCTSSTDYQYCSGPGVLNYKGKCHDVLCRRYEPGVCEPLDPIRDWNNIKEPCYKGVVSQNCTQFIGQHNQPLCNDIGKCISLNAPTPMPYTGPPTPEPTFLPPTHQPTVPPPTTPPVTVPTPPPVLTPTFKPSPQPTPQPTSVPVDPVNSCLNRVSCLSCYATAEGERPCAWCAGSGGGYCSDPESADFVSCFLLPPGGGVGYDFRDEAVTCPTTAPDDCSSTHGTSCESCLVDEAGCGFCYNGTVGAQTGGCFGRAYASGCKSRSLDWIDEVEGDTCPGFIATAAPTVPPTPSPPDAVVVDTCPPRAYDFAAAGGCASEIQRSSTTASVIRDADMAVVLRLRAAADTVARADGTGRIYLSYVLATSGSTLPGGVVSASRKRAVTDAPDPLSAHVYALQLHESSSPADLHVPFVAPLLVCAPLTSPAFATVCLARYWDSNSSWACLPGDVSADPDDAASGCGPVADGLVESPSFLVYTFLRRPEAVEDFDETDENEDESIDEEELEDFIDECGADCDDIPELDGDIGDLLDQFDKDGDGKLSPEEFFDFLDWLDRKKRERDEEGEGAPGTPAPDSDRGEGVDADDSTGDNDAVVLAVAVAAAVVCCLCLVCLCIFFINSRRKEKPVFVVDKEAEMVDFSDLKAADDDSKDEEIAPHHKHKKEHSGSRRGTVRKEPRTPGRTAAIPAENLEVEYIEEISSSDSSEDLVVAIP
jgi:hypothetical protein